MSFKLGACRDPVRSIGVNAHLRFRLLRDINERMRPEPNARWSRVGGNAWIKLLCAREVTVGFELLPLLMTDGDVRKIRAE